MSYPATIELNNPNTGALQAKIYTPVVEPAAMEQLQTLIKFSHLYKHIAVMPDVHASVGSAGTVGTVIATVGAIIPSAVGVDIGCVDKDTEFLSPDGWVKFSDWSSHQVMQFNPSTNEANFVNPIRYVKLPCDAFYHLKTKYGIDQMLSEEHRVLYYKYDRSYKFNEWGVISAGELASQHRSLKQGFRGRILTSFTPLIQTQIDGVTDEELRVIVMVCADGHIRNTNTHNCVLSFKKDRKVNRATELLQSAGILYTLNANDNTGITHISFNAPTSNKKLNYWRASLAQLNVIVDEIFHWDGNEKDQVYFTRDKDSADFVHYAMSATGNRSVLREDVHKSGGVDYRVFKHANTKIGMAGVPKKDITIAPSQDGYKYCFQVPSGYFVARRNGNIFVTGNCGMLAVQTNINARELPDSCEAIRASIESAVPVGFSCHEKYDKPLSLLSMREYLWLSKGAPKFLETNKIITNDNQERLLQQIGTLGGGNHFIELCLDVHDNVWIMLHSGSRGVGNRIGTFYIARAKDEMQKLGIKDLASADLSYFNHSSPWWSEYMDAVKWAQEYASMNRRTMLALVVGELIKFFPHLKFVHSVINCHHNYISQETHYGKEVWITRKGAVSARKGEKAIIPGSMGARSYIVEGLGDPESYCSCPHGAGRKMSRGQAKKLITTAMHEAATIGVSCKKDASVLDESPAAYKDIDEVLKYSNRLVKPLAVLKQFVCVKG